MRVSLHSLALLFALSVRAPLFAQATPGDTLRRADVIAAAKEIMLATRYCTLVTIGTDGQPQARIVDPFPPDSDLTIWIATNPLTRKVQEIHGDPRVTLLYFNATTFEYVTVLGTAVADTGSLAKAGHWKAAWASLYKDQNRGDDYLLLRMRPSRLEVVSVRRGIGNDPKTWRPVSVDIRP